MSYNGISVPKEGAKITSVNGKLVVPTTPSSLSSRAMAPGETSGRPRFEFSTPP